MSGLSLYPLRCTLCGVPKAWADFGTRRRAVSGRSPECRSCAVSRVRKWRDERPGVVALQSERRRRHDPEGTRKTARDWYRQANRATREKASNSGKEWTSAELAYLASTSDSRKEISRKLGRSLSSIGSAKGRIQTDPRYARLAEADLGEIAAPAVINLRVREL